MKLRDLFLIMDARLKAIVHFKEGVYLVEDEPTNIYFYLNDMESRKPILCSGFYEAKVTKVINDGYVHIYTDFDALA